MNGGASAERRIVLLNSAHAVTEFDCGEPARNLWLATRAAGNQRTDDSRTYVVAEGERVLGFYALAVGSIIRASLPGALRKNAPDPVSCLLLAQLAVDLPMQGHGLSRALVLHAMGQAIKIVELAGCRLFAVHPARPELAGFYARFGFAEIGAQPALMAMSLHRVRNTIQAVNAASGLG